MKRRVEAPNRLGWTPRFKCGWIIHTDSTATFARTATAFDCFTQCWRWCFIGKSINLACFISISISTLKNRRPMVAFLHFLHWESTCHPPRNNHHAYNVLRQRKKDWCCFSHVIWSVLLANFQLKSDFAITLHELRNTTSLFLNFTLAFKIETLGLLFAVL